MQTYARRVLVAVGALIALAAFMWAGEWLGQRYLAPDDSAAELIRLHVPADCLATRGCVAEGEGLAMELVLPDPVRPLEAFPVRIQVQGSGAEAIAWARVEFEMTGMDMGVNRVSLTPRPEAANEWRGRATLPVCVTGRSDWLARVSLGAQGRVYRADFPFPVTSP